MRDIRQDLAERINAIRTEQSRLATELKELEAEEEALKALLQAENRRFPKRGATLFAAAIQDPAVAEAMESASRLGQVVLEALSDGKEWSLNRLKPFAEQRGIHPDSPKASLGRMIHGSLMSLKQQGLAEISSFGNWKLAARRQNGASTTRAAE
jgi:hypothetical protein